MKSHNMESKILYNQLLKHYRLDSSAIKPVGTIYKSVAVYKVHTKNGIYCVKPYPYTEERFRLLLQGLTFFQSQHSNHTPILYRTKTGAAYFKLKQQPFYVTDWYSGERCDFYNTTDIRKVVRALARVHKIANRFTDTYPAYKNQSKKHLQSIIKRHSKFLNDLTVLKKYNDFHPNIKRLLANSHSFIQESEQAVDVIQQYLSHHSYKLHECFCHNDLTSYNCMYNHSGKIKFIDFDNCRISNRIYDFSLLLANTMDWSWDRVKYAIENYGTILPWTKSALRLLDACLMLPQEIWYIASKWKSAVEKKDTTVFDKMQVYFENALANISKRQSCLIELKKYIKER